MREILAMALACIVALAAASCGSDGPTETSGKVCSSVSSYGCFEGVVHRCSFDSSTGAKTWLAREDCSKSSTANCQCAVIDNVLGQCTVGGDNTTNATTCTGTKF